MGGSTYSHDDLHARFATRAATGTPDMKHDADVKSGTAKTVLHPMLDIRGKRRESRDSPAHPRSKAIAVVFDHTGSMGGVPAILQQKLGRLMSLVIAKGYCEDPQLCFGCVGDYHTDHKGKTGSDTGTLQIGQFESGAEIDDAFTAMALLGRGGGTYEESYELAAWYFANRVDMDCFEKRGERGYLFLIGDEKPYPHAHRGQVGDVCGVNIEDSPTIEQVFADLQRKFEVFFIIPGGTSHYNDPALVARWAKLVGPQRVIKIEDSAAVCEIIAATIGQLEGAIAGPDDVVAHLIDAGASPDHARMVAAATRDVNPVALARIGSGSLPKRVGTSGRL